MLFVLVAGLSDRNCRFNLEKSSLLGAQMAGKDTKLISGKTVSEHNTRESCWIIVHGYVYDVTDFLDG